MNPSYLDNGASINMMAFLSIFRVDSWFVFLLMVLVIFLVSFRIACQKQTRYASLKKATSFTYRAFLQQEVFMENDFLSSKILFFTASISLLLCWCYYEGLLTAYMTRQLPKAELTSFADAIDLGLKVLTK